MNTPNTTIAIRIVNPSKVSAMYGECAGDYTPNECQFWIGTERELYPSASAPKGAVIIDTPVQFCGGSAWTQRHRDAVVAAEETAQDARNKERRDEYVAFAIRRIAALRQFPSQPNLEEMGYSPEDIKAAIQARINELEAQIA